MELRARTAERLAKKRFERDIPHVGVRRVDQLACFGRAKAKLDERASNEGDRVRIIRVVAIEHETIRRGSFHRNVTLMNGAVMARATEHEILRRVASTSGNSAAAMVAAPNETMRCRWNVLRCPRRLRRFDRPDVLGVAQCPLDRRRFDLHGHARAVLPAAPTAVAQSDGDLMQRT